MNSTFWLDSILSNGRSSNLTGTNSTFNGTYTNQSRDGISQEHLTPATLKDATRVLFVIIFIVGILGNLMVCYILLKKYQRSNRRSIHAFTLNLAFADLLVLLIYLPSQMHLFETNMLWKIGEPLCRIIYLIVPLSIYASIGTLIAISRDRYIAVLRPMISLEKRNTKYLLSVIWLISFILTIPLLLVAQIKEGYCTEMWPSPLLYKIYWIFAFCIQFAIPVLILAIAHILIIRHLKTLKTPSAYCTRALQRRRQQQRLITMSITLVLVYVICMLPQHIVFFWMIYGDLESQPYKMYIFQVSNLMLILNSALNPVVYGTLNNDIKRNLLGICRPKAPSQQIARNWRTRTMELQTFNSSSSPLLKKSVLLKHSNSLDSKEGSLKVNSHTRSRHLAIRRMVEENGAKLL